MPSSARSAHRGLRGRRRHRPISGGILNEFASWRGVMFVNVPIRVVVYALGSRVLPETARHHGTFDLTGAITSVLGMGSLVQGFVNAASDGWSAPVTIGSFGFGIVMLALFVLTELHA